MFSLKQSEKSLFTQMFYAVTVFMVQPYLLEIVFDSKIFEGTLCPAVLCLVFHCWLFQYLTNTTVFAYPLISHIKVCLQVLRSTTANMIL